MGNAYLLTLMRDMLNCIVRITTNINSPPRDISEMARSLNQDTFFNVCNRQYHDDP